MKTDIFCVLIVVLAALSCGNSTKQEDVPDLQSVELQDLFRSGETTVSEVVDGGTDEKAQPDEKTQPQDAEAEVVDIRIDLAEFCGPCDDGNPCTKDSCIAQRDGGGDTIYSCQFEPLTETPCYLGVPVLPSICHEGVCQPSCQEAASNPSNLGCEFWALDLDNAYVPGGRNGFYDAAGQQYALAVVNPYGGFPAEVAVFNVEEKVDQSTVPGGWIQVFNLPRRDVDGTVLDALAYRLISDVPVTAYQFNPLENADVFSNDASVLYPSSSLGKEYWVVTREQTFEELRSYVTVTATRPGETVVTVDVTADTTAGLNVHTGQPIEAMASGSSLQIALQQFDVLNIATESVGGDMTGTHVVATQEVAVFGGSEGSNAPNTGHCLVDTGVCEWDGQKPCATNKDCIEFNTCCADHLEHQMPPIHALGLEYQAVKTFPRGQEKDVYRVVAVKNDTSVSCTPNECAETHLNAGQWFDFETKSAFTLTANKPVLMAQFIASQDAPEPNKNGVPQAGDAGIGDPSMLILTPRAQYRNSYAFLAPNNYELDYVTIVAPVQDKTNGPVDVWLDCPLVDPQQDPEACPPISLANYQSTPGNTFLSARLPVDDGFHHVRAVAPVAVYAYGYDQYVSYGYSAGSNLKDLGLVPMP